MNKYPRLGIGKITRVRYKLNTILCIFNLYLTPIIILCIFNLYLTPII